MKLKLSTTTIPVTLESEEGPQEFELRELLASARDQYMDSISDRVRIVDGRPAGIKKFEGMQADLLSRCLFHKDGVNVGRPVVKAVIQGWPASVVSELFKEAQILNHLVDTGKEKEEEAAKND